MKTKKKLINSQTPQNDCVSRSECLFSVGYVNTTNSTLQNEKNMPDVRDTEKRGRDGIKSWAKNPQKNHFIFAA